MTQNLQILYNTPSITPQQSGEFNTLLSKISQNLAIARQCIQDTGSLSDLLNSDITTEFDEIILNWHTLLSYLYDVLLPEMYVFFHDDSTNSQHRMQIHEFTLQLWEMSLRWLKNIHADVDVNEIILNNGFDNYVIGKGTNAGIACEILPIAKLSDISGSDYLDHINVFINIFRNESSLAEFLLRNQNDIKQDLEDLLRVRLHCFSQPTAETLAMQSELLLIGRNHPLIDYLLSKYTQNYQINTKEGSFKTSQKNDVNVIADDIFNRLKLNRHGKTHQEKKAWIESIITEHLPLALVLTTIMAFFSSFLFSVIIIFLAMVTSHILVNFAKNNIGIQRFVDNKLSYFIDLFLNNYSKVFIGLFVSSFIFDELFFFLFFILVTLSLTVYQYFTDNDLFNNLMNLQEEPTTDTTQPKQKSKMQHLDETQSTTKLLPLSVNHHAQNLKKLLSVSAIAVLDELIDTVNELYEYLDYLQEQHPYLATSVHELIMDITTNSVLRLDQLAKTFVKDSTVKPRAKKLFAKQHQQQVTDLFNHHIEEIQALNQSILEKQMAGFSQTGTQAERLFRDSIMELKILLRWYIAQQPDDFSATSHQVILDRLENTTLKQMMESFYQADTTDQQRAKLQRQIEDLLAHFKSHSPMNKMDNEAELLQLSYQSHQSIPNETINHQLDNERQEAQMATQDFIEFNEQYVKQLKQHW